jgi:Flp pilus assembly protein CpaB
VENRRVVVAIVAVILALVAGVGAYWYVSGADKRAEDKANLVNVLVANGDIARGTTGKQIADSHLYTEKRINQGAIPPGAVKDISEIETMAAAGPIGSGIPLVSSSFVNPGDSTGASSSSSGNAQSAAPQQNGSVLLTLEVDPVDAERLALAQTASTLYLTIVPPKFVPGAQPQVPNVVLGSPSSPAPTATADFVHKY